MPEQNNIDFFYMSSATRSCLDFFLDIEELDLEDVIKRFDRRFNLIAGIRHLKLP